MSDGSSGYQTKTLKAILLCAVPLIIYEVGSLWNFHVGRVPTPENSDFVVYYDAAHRWARDPLTLYDVHATERLLGFTYPPIAVIAFAPFTLVDRAVAYAAFLVMTSIALVFLAILVPRTVKLLGPEYQLDGLQGTTVVALLVASGPAFSNSVSGQMNPVVLLLSLGAIHAAHATHSFWGAILLALACWIKIYPGLLLFAMLFNERLRNTALLAIGIGAVIPLVLLPFLPLELYTRYFLELLPHMSGSITNHIYNQSLTATLVRLITPADQWTNWHVVVVLPWIRAVNIVLLCSVLALFATRPFRSAKNSLLASLVALAIVPLIAPLGWGHAFLFAVPLVAYLIVSRGNQCIVLTALVAWILLLIPAYSSLNGVGNHSTVIQHALYFRYPVAVLAVIAIAVYGVAPLTPRRSRPKSANPSLTDTEETKNPETKLTATKRPILWRSPPSR